MRRAESLPAYDEEESPPAYDEGESSTDFGDDPLFQALKLTEKGREALKTEYLYGKEGKLLITNGAASFYDPVSNTIGDWSWGNTGKLNERFAQKRMIHEQTHRWYYKTGKTADPLQYKDRPEDYVEPDAEGGGCSGRQRHRPYHGTEPLHGSFTAAELIYVKAYREGYQEGYNDLKKMMPWAGEEQEELLRAEGRAEGIKRGREALLKAFKSGELMPSTSTKDKPETYPEYYTKQWYEAQEGQGSARIRPAPGGDSQLKNDLALVKANIVFAEAKYGRGNAQSSCMQALQNSRHRYNPLTNRPPGRL